MENKTFKQQVRHDHSLFSYDLSSGEVELVSTITLKDLIPKYYKITKKEGKIYLQAVSIQSARNKFEEFIKFRENEKSKVESSKELQK